MELKELTEKTFELFGVEQADRRYKATGTNLSTEGRNEQD